MSLDSAAIAEVGPGYFVLSPGEVRETRPGVILTHGPIPMPEFVEPGRVRLHARPDELVPVTLSHYGITGHGVWQLSSLVFLAVIWGIFAMDMRVPETRAITVATPWARRVVSMLLFVPMQIALVRVVLGLIPDQEPALYLTAVGLLLVTAASFLLSLAYSFGRPQTA